MPFYATIAKELVILAAFVAFVVFIVFLCRLGSLYKADHETLKPLQKKICKIRRHARWAFFLAAVGSVVTLVCFVVTLVCFVWNLAGWDGTPMCCVQKIQARSNEADITDILQEFSNNMEREFEQLNETLETIKEKYP